MNPSRFLQMTHGQLVLFTLLIGLSVIACDSSVKKEPTEQVQGTPAEEVTANDGANVSAAQRELDEIYTLLAYGLVYLDWQADTVPRSLRRGYNIGSVLVNQDDMPVFHALNCVNETNNSTQHGELRAIVQYLDEQSRYNLNGYSIYTTLEPCVMCAGMIVMTGVERVVFGQYDVKFSGALERLSLDSRSIGGYAPYPRTVDAYPSSHPSRFELDSAYQHFMQTDEQKYLSKFLASKSACRIFSEAGKKLNSYKLQYANNQRFLDSAILYLQSANEHYIK